MATLWRELERFIGSFHPVRLVVLGYSAYIFVGWLLLALPVMHEGHRVLALDALFTAVSAVSTTGLVTVSTGTDFGFFGQLVIVILIQLGGIGFMTFSSFVLLSRSGTLSERRQRVGMAVFSLPREFRVDKFIRSVVTFTVAVECIGAVSLFAAFRHAGVELPLWTAIFHSVSAFCTAGFSLYDTSFEQLAGDFWINLILGIESYLGAIGFIVCIDVWRRIRGKSPAITLTSRVIIITTTWLSFLAMLLFFLGEPLIQDLPVHERLMASFFQVMTSITTVGFNTVPIGTLSQASLFLITMLMIVGASPAGTGGGLKTTTFSAVFGVIRSAFRASGTVTFWGRSIPDERVRHAMANLGFYLVALIAGCYLLALTESFEFESLLFEAASALGTVGLSTGITAALSPVGKIVVIALMFAGRVGPLAIGVAIFLPLPKTELAEPDDLAV